MDDYKGFHGIVATEERLRDMGHDRTQPVDPHGAVIEESRSVSHTPGPWHVDAAMIVRDAAENEITLPAIGAQLFNAKANASLIASAPDLLAALKGIIPYYCGAAENPTIMAARAAIQKAEGK